MSAPLVVNTVDGTCWTRRGSLRGGAPLYAPADVCRCPEFVMATLAELAEHGIVGSADVLPMPVGSKPQAETLPLKVVAELNNLRMRLAGMANPPREVFLALYDGAEPELFTTAEAARECCDDLAKSDAHEKYWDWIVNEHGIHVQFWTHPDDDRPLSETSGCVTPIVVQGDDDVSELERLRARVAELEAERRSTNEWVDDAAEALRASRDRIAELEAEREALSERLRAGQVWRQGRSPELVSENFVSQSELRSIFGIPLTPPWGDGITRRVVPVQALREPEGEHYAHVHHPYTTPHDLDLPGTDGDR